MVIQRSLSVVDHTLCQSAASYKFPFQQATRRNTSALYVIVYNSLAKERSTIVRIPVSSKAAFDVTRVQDAARSVASTHHSIEAPRDCPMCHRKHVLYFDTGLLPPVGAVAFRITESAVQNAAAESVINPEPLPSKARTLGDNSLSPLLLSNGLVQATFDSSTGMLQKISNHLVDVEVTQEWGYYKSFDSSFGKSDVEDWGQNSGAYIFRPSEPEEDLTRLTPLAGRTVVINTTVGKEVHVTFQEPWMKQITRVFRGQPYVEVEYIVGPIPIDDGRGKEIVTRFSSSIQSRGKFYTDSNGREFLQRTRNHRPTWALSVYEPVAGNYYPVNAAMYIEDENAALSLLVDRSLGGASLRDGSLEIMVQRRTLADDGRGVDEALNETSGGMSPYPPYGNRHRIGDGVIVRGTFRVMVGQGSVGASLCRSAMDDVFAAPVVLVGSAPINKPVNFRRPSFSAIQEALPPNVMLLTFSKLPYRNEPTFLVRLAHQYGLEEDAALSAPAQVDLTKLFVHHTIVAVEELTLSGNQKLEDHLKRKKRWTDDEEVEAASRVFIGAASTIVIDPMDIRTFEVVVNPIGDGFGDEMMESY